MTPQPATRHPQLLPWLQVLIAALAMIATLPGRTFGLGLITTPLLADLHLSEVDYSWINLIATLIGAGFALGFGPLIDRFGARLILTLNTLLLAIAVYTMAHAHTFAELAISLTFVRGLGQSALSVVALALIGKWFVQRINLAMAIFAAIVSIGFVAAITIAESAIAQVTQPTPQGIPQHPEAWRQIWMTLSYALAIFSAISLLLTRSTPSTPSKSPSPTTDNAPVTTDTAPTFTFAQALRLRAFWTLALTCALFNLLFSAIAIFSQNILIERGFPDKETYQASMGLLLMAGLIANFIGGYLASKISLQRLLSIGMLLVTASLLILPFAKQKSQVYAYAGLMGLAGGVVTVVFFACWPKLFGRPHLGKIQGAAQVLTVLFSAAGPLILAAGKQHQGSFSNIFLIMSPIVALAAIACWLTPSPGGSRTERAFKV